MTITGSGVFGPDQLDELGSFFDVHGYATLRGALDDADLLATGVELAELQRRLAEGGLDGRHGSVTLDEADATIGGRHGSVTLDEADATIGGRPFAHYVYFATQASPLADRLVHAPPLLQVVDRLLGPRAWLLDYEVFGVVYQDSRPDPGSGYSRIGWHTDHQSGPHLDIWPGTAFTIHFDPTSPANGFLRVLPGSHRGGVEGMPLGFERVPGEIAVYQERGDVLFHHADLWHSAARGTADGEPAVRRHLRGSWHGGTPIDVGHGTDDYVKNALR